MSDKKKAIFYALLAAGLYALSVPCSKILLESIPATFMAGLLYLGAGIGVGFMYALNFKKEGLGQRLSREDWPYTVGMVVLDTLAPIFLMVGLKHSASANASLLGNFEIVATTLIALLVFKEKVSSRLWAAVLFIVVASAFLCFEGLESLRFSYGSLFVLLAALCWGLENNCTRVISEKSPFEIVTIKGFFSGFGSVAVALAIGERLTDFRLVPAALALGFVAYGLSIFTYIKAQRHLGAAKTSAYYALAPFIGSFLAFALLKEALNVNYLIGLLFMVFGSCLVVADTLAEGHSHKHYHIVSHFHNGRLHTHVVWHTHEHCHFANDKRHSHRHSKRKLERELMKTHVPGHNLT